MSHTSLTKNRHHTMVVTYGKDDTITGVMLEKDWFSVDWCLGFPHHQRIVRPQGTFHLVTQSPLLSPQAASILVDAAIMGKVKVIDLREFNVNRRIDKLISGEVKR